MTKLVLIGSQGFRASLTEIGVAAAHARLDSPTESGEQSVSNAKTVAGQLTESVDNVRRIVDRLPNTARSLRVLAPRKPTALTGQVSAGRSWVSISGSLAAAKTVGHAVEGTVNDVILAAVATGFTAALRARGQDVRGKEARCLMPISLRDPRDARSNNQVSILPVVLPLGIDDPLELISKVHKSTMAGKTSLTPENSDALVGAVTRFVPNMVQEIVTAKSAELLGYIGDSCVTNVPGPPFPIYFMGQQITAQYPILPIAEPLRLGVAITSLDGNLQISDTGDDQNWDEVRLIARTISQSLADWSELINS